MGDVLIVLPLLHDAPKDIGNRLVQSPTLVLINEPTWHGILRHAVCEFVGHDVQRTGKTYECLPITITIDHLPTIPERVIVMPAVVYGCVQTQPSAIDRV